MSSTNSQESSINLNLSSNLNPDCPICNDDLSENKNCTLHCHPTHTFCVTCLHNIAKTAERTEPKCPLCRASFTDDDIIKITELLSLNQNEEDDLPPEQNDIFSRQIGIIQEIEIQQELLELIQNPFQNELQEPHMPEQDELLQNPFENNLHNDLIEEEQFQNELQEAIVPSVQTVFNFSFSKYKTVRVPGYLSHKIHFMCKIQFESDSFEAAYAFIKNFIPKKYSKFITEPEFAQFSSIVHPYDFSYTERFCHLVTLDTSTNRITIKSTDQNLLLSIKYGNQGIIIRNSLGFYSRNKKMFEFGSQMFFQEPTVIVGRYDFGYVSVKVIENLSRFKLVDLRAPYEMDGFGI